MMICFLSSFNSLHKILKQPSQPNSIIIIIAIINYEYDVWQPSGTPLAQLHNLHNLCMRATELILQDDVGCQTFAVVVWIKLWTGWEYCVVICKQQQQKHNSCTGIIINTKMTNNIKMSYKIQQQQLWSNNNKLL